MKIISICLARINSSRLHEKLLQDINGKPLIHYTLNIMSQLGYNSYIYTNSEKIKKYSELNFPNINIKDKPGKYCQDVHLTGQELTKYNRELKADIFIYLAGTSPIRDINIIKNAIAKFIDNLDIYDCAMAVKELSDRMYYNTFMMPVNFYGHERTYNNSTTNKIKLYEETGSLYIFKKELLDSNFFINNRCMPVVDNYNYDIDTIEDLEKARLFLKR